jgi:hypothetical protein
MFNDEKLISFLIEIFGTFFIHWIINKISLDLIVLIHHHLS